MAAMLRDLGVLGLWIHAACGGQAGAMGCAASVSPAKPPAVQRYNFVGPELRSPPHLEGADWSDLCPSHSLPSTSSSHSRKIPNSRVRAYNAEDWFFRHAGVGTGANGIKEWEERFGDFLKNLEQMESRGGCALAARVWVRIS
eukprot:s1162_g7.t2